MNLLKDLVRRSMPYICFASLLMSVAALMLSLPHQKSLGYDYQNILVDVLSLLVTVLIGWNIYTVIDLRKTREEFASISLGASKELHGGMAGTEGTLWMIYHYLYIKTDPLGLPFRYIHHGLLCLYHSSLIGDARTCDLITDALSQSLVKPQNIVMSKKSKSQLIITLSKIQGTDKINNFSLLVEKIALIAVKEDAAVHPRTPRCTE